MSTVLLMRSAPRYSFIALLIAWAAAVWAGISVYLLQTSVRIPHFVELSAVLSGGACTVGACFGVLYLIVAARTRRVVLSAVVAVLINCGYVLWYLDAIMHQ